MLLVGATGRPTTSRGLEPCGFAEVSVAICSRRRTSGVLSVVVPSSGRFLGGGTKRGRLLVGKWAFVGWRRGVSS